MTQEAFDNLKIGDLVISPSGPVYVVVHFSNGPIVARHARIRKDDREEWVTVCPRREPPKGKQ